MLKKLPSATLPQEFVELFKFPGGFKKENRVAKVTGHDTSKC